MTRRHCSNLQACTLLLRLVKLHWQHARRWELDGVKGKLCCWRPGAGTPLCVPRAAGVPVRIKTPFLHPPTSGGQLPHTAG
jgi:hypothetical protein